MASFAVARLANWLDTKGFRLEGDSIRTVAGACAAAGLVEPVDFPRIRVAMVPELQCLSAGTQEKLQCVIDSLVVTGVCDSEETMKQVQ